MGQVEAFWSRVRVGGSGDCWPWTGATNEHGYGIINDGLVNGKRRMTKAHRRAFTLARGPIPEGAHVLHSCDNPPCCNPVHLMLGDHQANMDDMFAKGRRQAAVGTENGKSRLTEEQVREFRASYRGRRGELKAAVERLGVHRNTLRAVIDRRTWRHVE